MVIGGGGHNRLNQVRAAPGNAAAGPDTPSKGGNKSTDFLCQNRRRARHRRLKKKRRPVSRTAVKLPV